MSEWQPINMQAEQSVLGSLLKFGANDAVFEKLKPNDFGGKKNFHREIYQAMIDISTSKNDIDFITVVDVLGDEHFAYLGQMVQDTPSAANILSYAKIVKNKALERDTITKLQESIALIQGEGTTEQKTEKVINTVSQIDLADDSEQGLTHVNKIANEWLDTYDERVNNPDLAGIQTGVDGLDEIFGARGVGKTDMIVIGARPKMGKTQLLVKIAAHLSMQQNKSALVFSMEMPKIQIFERFITNSAQVSTDKFYQPMREDEFAKVGKMLAEVTDKDLYIDDRPNLSLKQIRAACLKHKAEHGEIGGIFVDYLTLMKLEAAARSDLAFGANSTGLKDLAKELGTPVFLLAQLSRAVDQRTDKRPLISDLRESGSIEQDADRIIFLYRDSVYNKDSELGGLTELIVAANRHGETGTGYVEMAGGWFNNVDSGRTSAINDSNSDW